MKKSASSCELIRSSACSGVSPSRSIMRFLRISGDAITDMMNSQKSSARLSKRVGANGSLSA